VVARRIRVTRTGGHDAAGGLDGGAPVDEFASAGGDTQLVARVAAVAAFGAQGDDQAVFAEGAEESRGGAEQLGGPAHGVGGVVVIGDWQGA
jgi:hypothetical protein